MTRSNITTKFFSALWDDERAIMVSIELVMLATIGVIGLLVGLTAMRNALLSKFADVARSVRNSVQS